jgi:hypothetical protein
MVYGARMAGMKENSMVLVELVGRSCLGVQCLEGSTEERTSNSACYDWL